jgi:PE family
MYILSKHLGGNMTSGFGVVPAAVDLSSLIEQAIGAEMTATTAAGAAALTGVVPMAADADSTEFAQALNASGGTYLATAADHAGQRAAFAGAQSLASSTYVAMDAIHGTALG